MACVIATCLVCGFYWYEGGLKRCPKYGGTEIDIDCDEGVGDEEE